MRSPFLRPRIPEGLGLWALGNAVRGITGNQAKAYIDMLLMEKQHLACFSNFYIKLLNNFIIFYLNSKNTTFLLQPIAPPQKSPCLHVHDISVALANAAPALGSPCLRSANNDQALKHIIWVIGIKKSPGPYF